MAQRVATACDSAMSKSSHCPVFIDYIIYLFAVSFLFVKITFVTLFYCVWGLIPSRQRPLKDEVILITGGGGGLGKALALRFAEHPVKIILWDIDEAGLQNARNVVESRGGWIRTYVCDITSEDDVKATANKVREEVGDVTMLINNAGILQNLPLCKLNSKRIRQTFDVNVISHFWTIREFLPYMLKRKKGHIVAISSISGLFGQVNYADYSSSKFAVVGLMECLIEELRNNGDDKYIHCTTVCPLTINTGLIHEARTRYRWMMPILTVEDAAKEIIEDIRKRKTLSTVPRRIIFFYSTSRVFPRKVANMILDFADYCKVPNKAPDEKV